MLVLSRGALLAATASIAAGLLAGPGVAYAADTSTPLTAAEMTAELKTVSSASAQAAAGGWKATVKLTAAGSMAGSEFFAVDPVAGVAYERLDFGGEIMALYVVAGKGMYTSLSDQERAAVKMMRRPSVRYSFAAYKSTTLDMIDGMSPSSLLADDVAQAGTKTIHDDGSADYRLTQDGVTMTAHVTAAGVLASTDAVEDGTHATTTYAYGPQHVTLPSASVTIGDAALDVGLAYLDMATWVKRAAGDAATDTLQAAHGKKISVSSLRNVTRHDVQMANAASGVTLVRAGTVPGGVRVYATNPWTHRTVSYTLLTAGRKVTIAKK